METQENYKGFTIKIKHDTYAENPWEAWDCCVPLITISGRHSFEKDYSNGDINRFLESFLSYNQVKKYQKRIFDLMNLDIEEFREEHPTDEYDRTDVIMNDYLPDFLSDGFGNMEKFCIEFDIKHLRTTSTGYSQGDWAELFFCWTPEFEEITGRDYKSMNKETFEAQEELFTAWAWGDVYSFYIEEIEDSCSGFYGDDHEKSGLLSEAKAGIDYYIEKKRKEKINKLKTLIFKQVPLFKRPEILQSI